MTTTTATAWDHMPWPARRRLINATRADLRDLTHELTTARRRLEAITARTAAARASTPTSPPTVEEITDRARTLLADLGPDPKADEHLADLTAAITTKEDR